MSAFTVEFENRSGELARLSEAMAARGVNIVVCGAAHGDTGTVAFIADDEMGARAALEGADIENDERPALTIRMENVAGPVRRLSGSSQMLASTLICSFRFEYRRRRFWP